MGVIIMHIDRIDVRADETNRDLCGHVGLHTVV